MATKETLKGYFKTGSRPTEEQFGELIDSLALGESVTVRWHNGQLQRLNGSSWEEVNISSGGFEGDGNVLNYGNLKIKNINNNFRSNGVEFENINSQGQEANISFYSQNDDIKLELLSSNQIIFDVANSRLVIDRDKLNKLERLLNLNIDKIDQVTTLTPIQINNLVTTTPKQ
jgi:hypothetical protein